MTFFCIKLFKVFNVNRLNLKRNFDPMLIVKMIDVKEVYLFYVCIKTNEDMENQSIDIHEAISRIKKLKKLYDVWKIAKEFIQN